MLSLLIYLGNFVFLLFFAIFFVRAFSNKTKKTPEVIFTTNFIIVKLNELELQDDDDREASKLII